jgi:hypothetical protein
MHLFRDEGVRDYGAAARLIPVIDYGPCFDGFLERSTGSRSRSRMLARMSQTV